MRYIRACILCVFIVHACVVGQRLYLYVLNITRYTYMNIILTYIIISII